MAIPWNELAERYKSALMEYLNHQEEAMLGRAWELGRELVASDPGILDLASLHQQVLEHVLARSLSPEDRGRLAVATEFYLQCLSPLEMVHRGLKESNATLQRLHHTLEQQVRKEQRHHRELSFAQEVQKSFLPTESPRVPGYRFSQYYQPARQVGGDYFDFMDLPNRRLAIAVGDVAGKGMPAALMMARVLAEQRYFLLAERTAAEVLTRLNGQLAQSDSERRFVTCVLMILDLESHRATVANAGHPAPLLRRKGSSAVGPVGAAEAASPLGVAPDTSYTEAEISLEPGDVFVMFTDGVTDAQDASGEFYQMRRLVDVLSRGPHQIDSIAETILQDVKRFAAGDRLSDDLTLICLGREP
jgi:serine phosphatase RsbU (regulator of sigma subunit)